MKKLLGKLLLCVVPVMIFFVISYETDIFNVFHYRNVRTTQAAKNENFIKTKYVLDDPGRFNAFILGSSRVANLPHEGLPGEINGENLNWYNMNYSMGCPKDNLETVKSLLRGGVKIKYLIVGIDEISMYTTYDGNSDEFIRKQYREYENNPFAFYFEYIRVKPNFSILFRALSQTAEDKENADILYTYGVDKNNRNLSVPIDERKMVKSLGCGHYFGNANCEPLNAIEELHELCEENGIELKIYTSPILESTYNEAISKGYFDFLKDVAGVTDFYNFSGLNEYTTDMRYYFDASHFIPYVGLKMEEVIFSDDTISDVSEFGAYITSENVDALIEKLENFNG